LNLLFQIAVRRRDDARLSLKCLRATHPLERAFLQNPQNFHLQVWTHFGDFVKEQRATPGQFKSTLPCYLCSGKSASLVAEQLAFHQFARDRPAIDSDERPEPALGPCMQQARHHLFACARFTLNQYGAIGGGNATDERAQCHHLRALAQELGLARRLVNL
jgi:hypothetical protein